MPRRNGGPLGFEAIKRHEKKGHGHGHGNEYLPWLTVHNTPSHGQSGRVLSWKSHRVQHLVSQGEQRYQLLLDWSDSVVDVREQFPLLPVEETIDLANRLGVAHPGASGKVSVLTTDFLVDVRVGLRTTEHARTFKYAAELDNPRVLEKFEIERRYWESRSVDWGVVLAEDLPLDTCLNLNWLFEHRSLEALNPLPQMLVRDISYAICRQVNEHGGHVVLARLCLKVDKHLGAVLGTSLGVAKFLLANKVLQTDMSIRIQTNTGLHLTVNNLDDFWEKK